MSANFQLWNNTFKILRKNDFKSRIPHPAKILIKSETKIVFFTLLKSSQIPIHAFFKIYWTMFSIKNE